jgi:hypothetical protein
MQRQKRKNNRTKKTTDEIASRLRRSTRRGCITGKEAADKFYFPSGNVQRIDGFREIVVAIPTVNGTHSVETSLACERAAQKDGFTKLTEFQISEPHTIQIYVR